MNNKNSISLLIADDHPIFLIGLVDLIEGSADPYKIIYKTDNGLNALENIRKLNPEVAILDITMPGMNGLDILKELKKEDLQTKVIILTMYGDEEFFDKAIDLGVNGYILKENAADELLEGLKAIVSGKNYISHALSEYLIKKNRELKTFAEKIPPLKSLTFAERNVLKLISQNKTSKDIAGELCISPRTVDNHRTHICSKLGLMGRNQLLVFAIKNKSLL